MKPVALPYPDALNTLGDRIRAKRLDLKLRQKDVARRLGVSKDTVACWENNRNQPSLRMIPRINAFLGYKPLLEAGANEAFGEWIVRVRRALGIRHDELALQLGVDPTTLARWERGKCEPRCQHLQLLEHLLELSAR